MKKQQKYNSRKNRWPDSLLKDTLPKNILPKDILLNGHFADGRFAERTFCRTDILPNGHFTVRTVCRKSLFLANKVQKISLYLLNFIGSLTRSKFLCRF
jgi:hypothetical protein